MCPTTRGLNDHELCTNMKDREDSSVTGNLISRVALNFDFSIEFFVLKGNQKHQTICNTSHDKHACNLKWTVSSDQPD